MIALVVTVLVGLVLTAAYRPRRSDLPPLSADEAIILARSREATS